jgi:hypothetical protein
MRWWILGAALMTAAPLLRADTPKPAQASKPVGPAIQVPYRLTLTNHVLVRAKINGKGPFNFILDTGAPALFVAKKVAEKAGVAADERGRAAFERFEIEGGVVIDNAWGRVDDLFQLEGMNGMGLAGVELHGVIGYNVLARYRIEYDFTHPKLSWTKLDFEPVAVGSIGGKSAPAGLDAIGGIMKFLGGLMGMKANFAVQPRGFLGAELGDGDQGITVRAVLPNGPAEKAGVKAGDRIKSIGSEEVESVRALAKVMAKQPEGAKVTLAVVRDGRDLEITVELGRGL